MQYIIHEISFKIQKVQFNTHYIQFNIYITNNKRVFRTRYPKKKKVRVSYVKLLDIE